jgi:hypothetical protein
VDDTLQKVQEHLQKISVARQRRIVITPDTELYRDLGMYGDVLVFDLVFWVQREFGVEGDFCLTDYAPGERPFFGLFRLFAKLVGKSERPYKSFKVRDVVTAIETKRWPE